MRILRLLCVCLLYGHSSYSQLKSIDSLINYMRSQDSLDGVVLVAKGNQIIYNKAFGFANRDWDIPNKSDTRFRLGSVSKQFIAFVILKLAEENKLQLTDPVSKYLPQFKTGEKIGITLQNLLTHTSGIFDYTDLKEFNSMINYPHDSLVNMISSHELNFPPSTQYAYSNSNFYLLTVIASSVAGKSFEELLKEKVSLPAGMKNTGIEHNRNLIPHRAYGYIHTSHGWQNADYIEMDNVAGGMYSTAADLLQWSLFIQKQFRSDPFFKSSIKPFSLSNGNQSTYSCGWCLLPGKIMHQGHINGFANQISIDTAKSFTIVILTNSNFKRLYATGQIIYSILNENKNSMSWLLQQNPVLTDYTGAFSAHNDTVYNKNENGILTSYFHGSPFPWKPFDKDEFYSAAFEGNIKYKRNSSGEIISVLNFEDYQWVEYKKVNNLK